MIDNDTLSNADEGQQYSLTHNKHYIHIGTQNVKGFNRIDKQDTFFEEYINNYHLDIIGLTETKIQKNQEKIMSKKPKKIIITDQITGDLVEDPFNNRTYKEHYQT